MNQVRSPSGHYSRVPGTWRFVRKYCLRRLPTREERSTLSPTTLLPTLHPPHSSPPAPRRPHFPQGEILASSRPASILGPPPFQIHPRRTLAARTHADASANAFWGQRHRQSPIASVNEAKRAPHWGARVRDVGPSGSEAEIKENVTVALHVHCCGGGRQGKDLERCTWRGEWYATFPLQLFSVGLYHFPPADPVPPPSPSKDYYSLSLSANWALLCKVAKSLSRSQSNSLSAFEGRPRTRKQRPNVNSFFVADFIQRLRQEIATCFVTGLSWLHSQGRSASSRTSTRTAKAQGGKLTVGVPRCSGVSRALTSLTFRMEDETVRVSQHSRKYAQ